VGSKPFPLKVTLRQPRLGQRCADGPFLLPQHFPRLA
jgi:hypothetical protein